MRVSSLALALAAMAVAGVVHADGTANADQMANAADDEANRELFFKITINGNDLKNNNEEIVIDIDEDTVTGEGDGDDRGDVDTSNCPNAPASCSEGGVNCDKFETYQTALAGERSDSGFPAFNLDTCIYEATRCEPFVEDWDKAINTLDGVRNTGMKVAEAQRIVALGSSPVGVSRPYKSNIDCAMNCKGTSKCCRYHEAGGFACDTIQSVHSAAKCICSEFTSDPSDVGDSVGDGPGFGAP